MSLYIGIASQLIMVSIFKGTNMGFCSTVTNNITKSWTFPKLQFPFGHTNINSINGRGHSLNSLSEDPQRSIPTSFLENPSCILGTFYFTSYTEYTLNSKTDLIAI